MKLLNFLTDEFYHIFRYSRLNSAPVYCQTLSTLHIAVIFGHAITVIPARLVYQSGSSLSWWR